MLDFLDDDDSFRGKLSDRGVQDSNKRSRSRSSSSGRGSSSAGRSFGRGRHVSASRPSAQRAAVKISSVRLAGRGKERAQAHAKYLQRDGAGKDGEPATAYGKDTDEADLDAFNQRCEDDRHQFRVILSPEFGDDLDLDEYARDVMKQVESDLDSELDWVAVNHFNTDNPHVHLVIRGVDAKGDDLVINRDYITHGFRGRAREVATHHLGPRSPEQIQQAKERSLEAERFTAVDRQLRSRADTENVVDLRADDDLASSGELRDRNHMLRRAAKLESLGLAKPVATNSWKLDDNLEDELRDLSKQNDIIRRMYAAKRTDPSRWASEPEAAPVVGRLLDRGLSDEHSGDEYLIVDGADGRVHHIEAAQAPSDDARPKVGDVVRITSPGDAEAEVERVDGRQLAARVDYNGPTWLDKELVQNTIDPASEGFGSELQAALAARHAKLSEWGLVDAAGNVPGAVIKPLRERERRAFLAERARSCGKRAVDLDAGDRLRGNISEPIGLAGGTYHVVEGQRRVAVLSSNKYLREHAGEVADVSMRMADNGRVRPFVRSVDPDQGLER